MYTEQVGATLPAEDQMRRSLAMQALHGVYPRYSGYIPIHFKPSVCVN